MSPSDTFTILFILAAFIAYVACYVWHRRAEFRGRRVCDDCGLPRLDGERPHEIVGCPDPCFPPLRKYQAQALGRVRRVIEKGPKRDCQVIYFIDLDKPDDKTWRFIDEIKRMLLDGYRTRDEIEHKTIGSDEPDSCPGPCPRVPSPYDHERTLGSYRLRPGSNPDLD